MGFFAAPLVEARVLLLVVSAERRPLLLIGMGKEMEAGTELVPFVG